MRSFCTAALAAAGLAWAAAAYAGPCAGDIGQLQTAYDATLRAAASSGPAAPQSPAATMHRQPTPNSVASAEVKLGELSQAKADAFASAMERARDADAADDKGACEQALGDARRALTR